MSYPGKSVFVCLLLVVACVCLQAHWGEPTQRPLDKMEELHGEAAIRQLKTDGGYDSLAAAMAAARYQINAAPTQASGSGQSGAQFYANNPGQQLHATFASDEVRVSAASNKTDGAELRLQLAGYGYGDQLEPLAKGVLTANGDRITIRKSAIRNPQSAIQEWYVNKPEGLEQGFTLAAPPARGKQGEWLRVALTVGEGWRASLRDDQQGALFERQADGLRFSYDHLLAYDAQGRTLPARMKLEGATLKLLVNDAQAVYPLTIDPIITQQRKLTAVDAAFEDEFGKAVALSGNTAVIGAPADDIGANANQGSAHVFVRSGSTWSLQQKLTASDGTARHRFGTSVAISGDTLAVGARFAHGDRGAVYVFTRSGTTWTQQTRLTANDGAAFDFFGDAVALNGDTLAAGAHAADISGRPDQGAVYLYVRQGTSWLPQWKLLASDGAAFDEFGSSVALSGDNVLVGAPLDDVGANAEQGSAYVFVRVGNTWSQQQQLLATGGAADDNFGCAVALSGDTAAVGAKLNDLNDVNRGSVYTFVRTGPNWMQEQQLVASGGRANDRFGQSVALSGDTLVAGAAGSDVGGVFDQGSAYVFVRDRATSLWSQQRHLFPDAEAVRAQPAAPGGIVVGVEFGSAVALSGDAILVGAPNDDGAFRQQGSAYAFVIRANNHVQQQQIIANDGAAFDTFGDSVALSGDTVVMGVVGDDPGGSAYVFTRSGAVWMLQQKLIANDGAANDRFGVAVALSGDTVVVGASQDNIGANGSQGSAYVFTRSNAVWTQQQKLTANDGAANDVFGFSVALSGDTVVVGAFRDAIGANPEQGSAYVFTRSGTVWTPQQKLIANDGAAFDNFGISVSLSGNSVAVGAFRDDSGTNTDQGSAYVFIRNGTVWTPQPKITANDGAAGDNFGFSVALSGDTVVVGAYQDSIGANGNQGSAYVFTRSGAVWTPQQKLTANDGTASANFGFSVALSGDTAVVGAVRGGNVVQGAAYVFTRGGTVWTQQQQLTANDGAASDQFSFSVALSGDTLVIGANNKSIGTKSAQGAAYVFASPACPTLTLSPATLPGAEPGVPYNQTLTASGGTGPYQFSLSEGTLPPGLTLAQNGQLSGTPTTSGTYRFTVTATMLSSLCPGSRSYTLTVSNGSCPALAINPSNFPVGQSGVVYGQTVAASGGAEPYSFTISAGALPTGLTLFSLPGGGMLTGTPTVTGNFNFTILATDANGCQGTRAYTLTITAPCPVITINPASLPNGMVGAAYSQTLTATGGASPYTFTVSAGNLPTGLSLSANGALIGTPTVAGSFNCVVRATDTNNCQGTRAYSMTINGGGSGATGLQFYPLAHPVRLLDTRPGATGCDTPGAQIPGGTSRTQTAAGRTCDGLTIPANAKALTGNITTVQSGGGYLTLFPSDAAQPTVANSNFTPNQILNNVFTVGLGAGDGAFKIFVTSNTNVVVDVTGYYAPPAVGGLYFHPLPKPIRLLETRQGETGCFTPGTPLQGGANTSQLGITSCGGVTIPAGAQALVGNATTVGPQNGGYLTLFPADAAQPLAASSNFLAGDVMNAAFTVGLSPSGHFNIFTTSTTNLVVDVLGYFSTQLNDANGQGLLFNPLPTPVRLLDTRAGFAGCFTPGAPMTGGATYTQASTGACTTIPATAQAVVGNATVVLPSGGGWLTFGPSSAALPYVATSNYLTGQIFNRHFIVGLGGDGAFKRYSFATTDLVIDLSGYFAP